MPTFEVAPIPGVTMDAPAAVEPSYSGEGKGGHYYAYNSDSKAWSPLYEKNKTFTLREARKVAKAGGSAVPSFTTYLGVMAKPQLERWKMENVANATYDRCAAVCNIHDLDNDYRSAIVGEAIAIASGASRGAMDLGTSIHDAMEALMKGQEYDANLQPYLDPAYKLRMSISTSTHPEECVGSLKYGYAGRCDDYTDAMDVIDYKSRKSGKNGKVGSYETDQLQLAAYGFAKFGNDFFKHGNGHIIGISTTTPGVVTHHKFTGPELIPAFKAFLALTDVWRFLNDFDPRRAV